MKLVQFTVWVPKPIKTAMKRIAKKDGKTLSALTRPILEEFVLEGLRDPAELIRLMKSSPGGGKK